ncbi:MAG: type 1 glutamine amidotransferase [Actinomycetota bacterium]|nr:type 1 glutamine amidotransferase [Actinomycetota bacterium]
MAARALVVTHTGSEGPGTLATWLPSAGLELEVIEPWRGEELPRTLSHAALVVMGGPQQAYDDGSATWLAQTKELIRSAVGAGRPVLGICLGAQLLAEATGGRVEPGGHGPELGARLVAKRDAAEQDPVFGTVPFTPPVIQWHWDTVVELPPGALLLASSTRYAHQAFRVGTNAYGLQFHVETPPEMVRGWVQADEAGVRAAGLEPDGVLSGALAVLPEIEEVWRPAVSRWAALALCTPTGHSEP